MTTELLFAILRSELFGEELSAEQKATAKENISALMKLSVHHDLGHLTADWFMKTGLVTKENELFPKIEKEKLSAIFRSVKMERELLSIKAILSSAGITHIPLKGSVIRSLYPESYMRTSCDIDMLILEEDIEKAIAVLKEKLNYTTDGERKFHDVSLFSPSGVHLELHFSILEGLDTLDRVLSRAWENTAPSQEGEFTRLLTNEFLLFHVIAHASYHFIRGGSGIKPFIDLHLLSEKIEFDRDALLALCREAGIDKFLSGAESLASVWFEGRAHDDLTEAMQSFILEGGVYGTEENLAAAGQAQNGGRFKAILSLIFMPYEKLKTLYPSLEGRKYLIPFYWVRRWFRVIFKGRIGKAYKTIKTNVTVTKESRESTSELFEKLGF